MRNLNKEIHNKEVTLKIYEENKHQLESLLHTLNTQSTHYVGKFSTLRHKLSLPVAVNKHKITTTRQGVTLLAPEGTVIHPVAAGRVVFSDWLNGYGLLLIIDHGQGYMSLYAHNQALYKTKGVWVEKGDMLAAVGHSGGVKIDGLYFEIRHNGRTLPPKTWFF